MSTVDPTGRVQAGGPRESLGAALEQRVWVLRPGGQALELDARGRVTLPLGVMAVLGLAPGEVAIVSTDRSGLIAVWPADAVSALLNGVVP